MNIMHTPSAAPDFAAIKSKQNAAWASGDYARIGTTLQIAGEMLAEAMDLPHDAAVLDVAAGNGNATLAFARRGNRVTSTDYVGALLARGRARAEADGLDVAFEVADVEALPFGDGEFDAVVSTYGCMFAPNQDATAAEIARVCRSGGRIGFANWTPEGFIGQVFKTIGGHVAPPAGVASPANWGRRDWLESVFGDVASSISIEFKDFVFRYRSPEHFMDVFRTYYGPMHKAFMALEPDRQAALDADLKRTVATFNTATDGSMRVPSRYAEVVIERA